MNKIKASNMTELTFREQFSCKRKIYGVWMGNLYLKTSQGHWEPVDNPSDNLRAEATKLGFTGTIAEKIDVNIHTYGHQLGQRAQTLKHMSN
jgi:hypothetical protein